MIDDDAELELELEEEDLSPEGVLLYSTQQGPRLFTLNNSSETVVAGIVLDETDDSFLVGLPAISVKNEKYEDEVLPYTKTPYSRLLKSAIILVDYLHGEFEPLYMGYIKEKGMDFFPQMPTMIEVDGEDSEAVEVAPDSVVTYDDNIGLEKEAVGDNKVVGMNDADLRKYLADKFDSGELISVSRKKQ